MEFTDWIKDANCESVLGRASALVLIAGLALEILTQVQTNGISGRIIADLNVEAQQAKLATEHLRKETAWRRLTKEEYSAIAAFARADGPHSIACDNTTDPETGPYANDICQALGDGGWKIDRGTGMSGGGTIIGVQIYPTGDAGGLSAAIAFGHQLAKAAHVHVNLLEHEIRGQLTVVIGSKLREK
jgi:hypothetical protein